MAPRTPKAATPTSSTKRVRLADEAETPAKSPKVAKAGTPASATRSTKAKDLKDKSAAEIAPIHAADAPAPGKPALKKAAKGKAAAKEEEDKVALEVEEEEDEAEIDFIKGFEESGDEADSSDEEDAAEASAAPFKLSALPAVAGAKGSSVQDKLASKDKAGAQPKKASKTGTIYLGRIPHGFHEAEMRSYFSQFGEITRLRLSRNKQTGASKHYAFVEFKYASVAQIVHETMDNYLLAGHILVCKVVPEAELHPKLWIGANRKFRVVPKGRRDLVKRTAERSDEQEKKVAQRLVVRENKKRDKLKALGIEYDFDGYAKKEVAHPVEDAPPSAKKAKKVEPKKKARKST